MLKSVKEKVCELEAVAGAGDSGGGRAKTSNATTEKMRRSRSYGGFDLRGSKKKVNQVQ